MADRNYFKERDNGYDQFMESFKALHGTSGTVGVHDSDNEQKEDGEISLAALLSIHEFGAEISGTAFGDITIPARPVLIGTLTDEQDEYLKRQERELVKVLEGDQDEVTMFRRLGAWAKGKVQSRFGSDDLEPNSPVTVELKGSSAPLVDDGQLKQSIDYQVQE